MYFSRIKLLLEATKSEGFWDMLADGYEVHRSLWSLFADGSKKSRDFLYRHEEGEKIPLFYCVSKGVPKDLGGIWGIESKEYNPVLWGGQRLAFSLRANPIVSKRDNKGRQHRHDVVMDAKRQMRQENAPMEELPMEALIVQEAGFEWFSRKCEGCGFSVKKREVKADGYQQLRFSKLHSGHKVSISTVDFEGLLTVDDTELFRKALYGGVGPAKGFGCGLLMVRRV